MTAQEIKELRELEQEITKCEYCDPKTGEHVGYYPVWTPTDLKFACAMRTALPDLLDAAESKAYYEAVAKINQRMQRNLNALEGMTFELYLDNDALGRQLSVLADENARLNTALHDLEIESHDWEGKAVVAEADLGDSQAREKKLREAYMAEGLKDAKAFMRSETVKAMNRELARLKTDLAARDVEITRLRHQINLLTDGGVA